MENGGETLRELIEFRLLFNIVENDTRCKTLEVRAAWAAYLHLRETEANKCGSILKSTGVTKVRVRVSKNARAPAS